MELPPTPDRVPGSTAEEVNERIREETRERIERYAGEPAAIEKRLDELDDEWDVERTLEANASALAFVGVALGLAVDRRWLLLPAVVTAFLFQHALQGWCPPIPVIRRLGVRTQREIDAERYALKAIRGDFEGIADADAGRVARRALEAV